MQIGAIVAGRLQSIERELRRDVFGGNVASALAGAAAFEKIVGEEANVSLDVVGANALHGGDGGRGQGASRSAFRRAVSAVLPCADSGERIEKRTAASTAILRMSSGRLEALVVKEYPEL